MYINEVECSNYRSYGANANISFKSGLNIIIGENNSGKSNIVRAVDIIFNTLRNHTRITSHELADDGTGNIKKILSGTPELSLEDYHNKNSELDIKVRISLRLEGGDSIYLDKIKGVLKNATGARMRTPEEIDDNFRDGVGEIELVFIISHRHSPNDRDTFQPIMVFKTTDKGKNKLRLDEYLSTRFDFDKFTDLLKQLIIVFPEFRTRPQSGHVSDILLSGVLLEKFF